MGLLRVGFGGRGFGSFDGRFIRLFKLAVVIIDRGLYRFELLAETGDLFELLGRHAAQLLDGRDAGCMTTEQLEEIQGISPEMVEQIQDSVNAYYGQFEDSPPAEQVEPAEDSAVYEEPAAEELAAEEPAELEAGAETEAAEEVVEGEEGAGHPSEIGEQFGTIDDAGSSTHNQADGADSEDSDSGNK